MEHKRHQTLCGKSVKSVSIYQIDSGNLFLPLALFGVVKVLCVPWSIWSTSPATSLLTSSGLESSVMCMHFTYAVQLVQHITIMLHFKHVKLTLDEVYDSRARVVCWDGYAGGKLSDSSQ